MSSPDAELQRWFDGLSNKVKRRVQEGLRTQAHRVRDAIKSAAAIGDTGNLAESVRVEDGKDDTELLVVAGGDLTTKRMGSGSDYDYALAVEFGTTKMEPNPFFFSTWRVMQDDVVSELEKVAADAMK